LGGPRFKESGHGRNEILNHIKICLWSRYRLGMIGSGAWH
jgi:hypothetical protein